MKGVRLPYTEIQGIRQQFREIFSDEDRLWLYGSQADLSKRGEEIELYVETNNLKTSLEKCDQFFMKLLNELGEKKIDIVVNNGPGNRLRCDIAKAEGIQLV
jgi:uncharacterized protein